MANLHFPFSLAVRCGHMTKCYPMECERKLYILRKEIGNKFIKYLGGGGDVWCRGSSRVKPASTTTLQYSGFWEKMGIFIFTASYRNVLSSDLNDKDMDYLTQEVQRQVGSRPV